MNGFKHPKGYYPLFGAFMLERAGYYGLRTLLLIFMLSVLKVEPEKANSIQGWFIVSLFFTPFLFGYLADSVVGIKKSATLSCAFMALGMVLISLSSMFSSSIWLYVGLVVVSIAQGFFRPSAYTMLGGLYSDKNDPRRDSGFTLILIAVNIGAFIAPVACGFLGQKVSWGAGFLMAGLFCLSALPLVNMVKDIAPHSVHSTMTDTEKKGLYAILVVALFSLFLWSVVSSYSDVLSFVFTNSVGEGFDKVRFWMPVSALIAGLALAPFFAWLWVWLDKKGDNISTVSKFIVGFVIASLSFVILYIVFLLYQRTGTVNVSLLILATVVSSTSEFFVAPIAVSLLTKLSPIKISAFVIGTWLMLGYPAKKVSSLLMPKYDLGSEFWLFAKPFFICFVSALVLFLMIKPLKRWMKNVH